MQNHVLVLVIKEVWLGLDCVLIIKFWILVLTCFCYISLKFLFVDLIFRKFLFLEWVIDVEMVLKLFPCKTNIVFISFYFIIVSLWFLFLLSHVYELWSLDWYRPILVDLLNFLLEISFIVQVYLLFLILRVLKGIQLNFFEHFRLVQRLKLVGLIEDRHSGDLSVLVIMMHIFVRLLSIQGLWDHFSS